MPIDFDAEDGDPHQEIRAGVRKLCAQFPGEYWRRLDREAAYPADFVKALTAAGYLSALIPEEYGGAGLPLSAAATIMEEIQRAGCNGAACHAQMYIMGDLLRHGSPEQKRRYLPGIASGELRLQAFGVTEPSSGTDTSSIKTFARREDGHYVINGQKIWTSRSEYSDLMLLLARTTPKHQLAKRTDGLSVFFLDMRTAKEAGSLLPPKHILNAPTRLMKEEGYGADYAYDHDAPDAFSGQDYFPEALGRQKFYDPPDRGFEREIRKRLDYWAKLAQAFARCGL